MSDFLFSIKKSHPNHQIDQETITMNEAAFDVALDLMRRLPPQGCEKHLTDLVALAPDLCESLLTAVDQPLKVAKGFIFFYLRILKKNN